VVKRCETLHHYYLTGVYSPVLFTLTNSLRPSIEITNGTQQKYHDFRRGIFVGPSGDTGLFEKPSHINGFRTCRVVFSLL
jgi:hypothetical protein